MPICLVGRYLPATAADGQPAQVAAVKATTADGNEKVRPLCSTFVPDEQTFFRLCEVTDEKAVSRTQGSAGFKSDRIQVRLS